MNLATIDEVAKTFKVSVSTIRTWMRQGLFPEGSYIKIAKTYRFNMDVIQGHFLQNSLSPQPKPVAKPERKIPVQLELDLTEFDKDL